MSYLHIVNLYRPEGQDILLFRECYALEKLHGTSAHLKWKDNALTYFTGEGHQNFVALFNEPDLVAKFAAIGENDIIVYGENYGGKIQGQSNRYGKQSKFVVFDVRINGCWLTVPQAEDVAVRQLGLEFVHYVRCSTDIETLNAERDKPSVQAVRNGIVDPMKREGVVLRPLIEVTKNNGDRVISKHKGDDFKETATPRKVVDPSQLVVLNEANAIANEWVTAERMEHVLQKMEIKGIQDTPLVIKAMLEDVHREAKGEIVESKDADRAISRAAAVMFKKRLQASIGA